MMNEELQQRLKKYMDFIESSVKETGDFVIEQSPLVIQEFLSWYFYSHLFFLIVSVVFGLIFISIAFYALKGPIINDNDDVDIIATIAVCIFSIISILSILYNSYNLIKVTVAPRLVILEKISELIQ